MKKQRLPGCSYPMLPFRAARLISRPLFLSIVLFCSFSLHSQTVTPTQSDKIPADNGNNKADPGETIRYKIDISVSGSDATGVQLNAMPDANTTFVGGTFLSTSVAADDGPYACTGNVPIDVPAASGVLLNDFDDNLAGATLSVVTPPTKGSVMLNNDGSFTYTPNPGVTGMTDQFTYRIDDATIPPDCTPQAVNIQATVTIDISNLIWFIDNSSMAATSDGRLNSPFKTLSDFNGNSAAAGDVIYIEETGTDYPGGIVLQNSEKLFGEGHTGGSNLADVLGFTLAPFSPMLPAVNGTRPVVTNAAGDGVQLASGNTLRGFNIGNCSDFGIDDNGAAGTLTVSEVNITNATGGGWRTDNGGTLAVTLGSLSSTGGANGINLSGCSGTFSVSGTTSVTNSTSTGVSIASNTATVTFNALNITNTMTNQTGLFAGGGTINSTSGAISTGSGRGVDIDNAALGMVLTSVSCDGCPTGIDLNTTTGSFTINGSGSTVGTGGTLQNITAEAILLTNTGNISFNGLNMMNVTREGIRGVEVNSLSVTNGSFNNIGSADPHDVFGFNRDALGDNGLIGNVIFQNLTITNFAERAIDIVNESSGTLDLDIINVDADNNNDMFGEDAIRVQGEGTVNTDVLISGGTFNNIESDVLAYFAQGTGTNNVVVTNVTSTNGGGPDNNPNGGGITIVGSGGSTTTFNINSSNLTGVQGEPVLIVGLPGPNQTLTMNGTIGGSTSAQGNILSSDNADGISLDFDGDPAGTSTMNTTIDINNNTISFDDDGLGVDYRDAAGTGNITIRNNAFTAINGDDGMNDSDDGIFIFSDDDTGSAGTMNLNVAILNNNFTGINNSDNIVDVEDIRDSGRSGCFRIIGNNVTSGDNRISLDFDATSNGGFVPQASVAEISSDNNSATVTIVDQNPTFNSTNCDNVPLP